MLQTCVKNRLIRRGIVALALLAVLPGPPVAAAQTFDEAVAAYERGDYATAMRGFRVHAEQGNAGAQVALGVMYDRGEGVPQNYIEAATWYRKAAEQGNADAQYNLGIMYSFGKGVPEDDAEAAKWFRKAAEQGAAAAQYNLGLKHLDGEGVPEDDVEAVKWYRKAAEQAGRRLRASMMEASFRLPLSGALEECLAHAFQARQRCPCGNLGKERFCNPLVPDGLSRV